MLPFTENKIAQRALRVWGHMGFQNQPAREQNIEALVSFFKSGVKKPGSELKIGIELEHTLLTHDGRPVSYSDEFGQKWLLEQLQASYPEASYGKYGDLIGVARPGAAVTLEPAAQVELSAGPFTDLREARQVFESFEAELAVTLEPHGISVHEIGCNPAKKAAELELIPKARYAMMDAYLGAISMFGVCMMRASASAQVSIDYTSDEDCLRKMRVANALCPIFALMCDNAPTFEAAPRTHQMVRTEIWEFCDPDRCNTVPGVMDEAFTFEKYAEYILDTPAVFDPADNTHTTKRTFGEIYAERPMERAEVEHALSLFFNDVRLKTYIEIRPADAMPVEYTIAYAALIKALFYAEGGLSALEELLGRVSAEDIARAKHDLMREGYAATVYGRPAAEVVDGVIAIAKAGADEDLALMQPLCQLAEQRTTLACIAEGKC